ncbi:hypothetical protein X760_04675 [Mesorhizobium sp. LSHC422A00]|nr:hypothetical protein X760_04675 [Mesorhizobium sp. LSHC422A00]
MIEKSAAPWPLLQIAIEPKSRADQEKLATALSKLADEDPWLHVKQDAESGQTIVAGRDELHLDIVIDHLRRESRIEVNVGAPKVAYRETITRKHEQDYTHNKQSGGTPVVRVSSPASRLRSSRMAVAGTSSSGPRSPTVRFRTNMLRASKRGCGTFCLQARLLASRCLA